MKNLPLLAGLLFATAAFAGEPQKIAYEQNDAVWVANADGSGAKKVADGQSPDLSPDATKLAFNTVEAFGKSGEKISSKGPASKVDRHIAVADLASGEIKVFKDIPSDNCMEALWSPDGAKVLFCLYAKDDRKIGVVNADGTGFRSVDKAGAEPHAYWSSAWAADGQSFFAQDMETLCQIGLDGTQIKKWTIEKLVPKGGMSGDVRLDVSPDGSTLLMDVEMDEKVKRKDWDGPLPAIWTLNLATGKVTRVTPKTQLGWDSHWFGPDAIIFASEEGNAKDPSIYRMSLDGKTKKLLVKNARLPSAR